MLDRAVFAGRVHRLKHEQQRPVILCIKPVLQIGEFLDAFLQQYLRFLFKFGLEPSGIAGIVVF
jgi:hypothetical protein